MALPTFDHIQDSGKHRRIDNGRKSRHNQATAYTEELDLCNALQPAVHAKVLCGEAEAMLGSAGILAEDIRSSVVREEEVDWRPLTEYPGVQGRIGPTRDWR